MMKEFHLILRCATDSGMGYVIHSGGVINDGTASKALKGSFEVRRHGTLQVISRWMFRNSNFYVLSLIITVATFGDCIVFSVKRKWVGSLAEYSNNKK